MQIRNRVFSHSGDTGDLIYALASIKTIGGGCLRLVKIKGSKSTVREPFSPGKVELLRPFLEAQPYIHGVEYGEIYDGSINLDGFRKYLRNRLSLCDAVADNLKVPHHPRNEPWLYCIDPNPVAPVVISRSPRYHSHDIIWGFVKKKYNDIIFVGLPEEHEAWQKQFGEVRYQPTLNWWELCRVIAGAQLFIGNQSAPMALALGLCVPKIVQEVYPQDPNCHFERPGVYYFPSHRLSYLDHRLIPHKTSVNDLPSL
jgi:hypothetical protein